MLDYNGYFDVKCIREDKWFYKGSTLHIEIVFLSSVIYALNPRPLISFPETMTITSKVSIYNKIKEVHFIG